MAVSIGDARASRSWCRACGGLRSFRPAGRERTRKEVLYFACLSCGRVRTQLADLPDADGLCRSILDKEIRKRGVHVDYEDMLSLLWTELWDLYLRWDVTRGVRFTPYATGLLRLRAANWYREQLGRDVPKALTNAISLDALEDDGQLGGSLADWQADFEAGRSPDLAGVLAS